MSKPKSIIVLAGLLALAALSSCNLRYGPLAEKQIQQTADAAAKATFEALYGTLTPTSAFDSFEESGDQLCSLYDCTKTAEPERTATPTVVGTPEPHDFATIDGGSETWVWYSSDRNLSNSVEIVRDGTTWAVLEELDTAVRIEITVWTPANDFTVDGRNIRLKDTLSHPWDHAGGETLCHTHGWNDNSTILARIPCGTSGTLVGDSPSLREYRDTATGSWTFGPGWIVTYDFPVWIPIESVEL